MGTRAVKEGMVGLVLVAGASLLAGSIIWVRGANFRGQRYGAVVEMPDALGLNLGSPVRYRGVKVGTVTSVTPGSNGVDIGFQIQPSTLLIPRDSIIETSQSGFVGQVTLSITPMSTAPKIPESSSLTPFNSSCDAALIVCNGDRLVGQAGSNFDELIRATTRIATLLDEGELLQSTNITLKNLSRAAISFQTLSRDASTTLGSLNQLSKQAGTTLTSVNQLSQDARVQVNSLGDIKTSVRQAADSVSTSANRFGQIGDRFILTADGIDGATTEISALLQNNRGDLIATLRNLNQASQDLKIIVRDLSPIIGKVNESQLIENLDSLVANGAEATESLKLITSTASSPVVLLELAETLGAARTTFQNTQKITTDLEQLTGNAEFRDNLLKLINGLSQLVSSTQDLEQQYNGINPSSIQTTAQSIQHPSH